ncbi:MAG: hypothetical protein OXG15_02355, partial [Gammaproteobacteria bacterium]|nr:hypothetical protein [Gammaproteobacteria bacterium]
MKQTIIVLLAGIFIAIGIVGGFTGQAIVTELRTVQSQLDELSVTIANPVDTVTIANPVDTVTIANPVDT